MNTVSKERLLADHKKMIFSIRRAIARRQYDHAIELMHLLAALNYKLPYLPTFSDPALEEEVKSLSGKVCRERQSETVPVPDSKKVVMLDSFGWDARGFTQQYLYALWDIGCEILFIRTSAASQELSQHLLAEIKQHPGTTLLIVDDTKPPTERILQIVNAVREYNPSRIFMHLSPWDIIAVAAMHHFPGCEKLQIDFTDHAFWLGTGITDKLLVFREWGAALGRLRGIAADCIYKVKSYPILTDSIPFKNFPVSVAGKIIGFSGGSVYKIRDDKNTFLNAIAALLRQHPEFVFLFAQIGPDEVIRDFIEAQKLQDRFILIGNRTDIYQVFAHIDIYINTYPYGGGNMLLYAAATKKPVLALSDEKLPHTHIDQVFDNESLRTHSSFDEAGFLKAAAKLITDGQLRATYGADLGRSISDRKSFACQLQAIVDGTAASEKTPVKAPGLDRNYLFQTHSVFEAFDRKKYFAHLRAFFGLKGLLFSHPGAVLASLLSGSIKK